MMNETNKKFLYEVFLMMIVFLSSFKKSVLFCPLSMHSHNNWMIVTKQNTKKNCFFFLHLNDCKMNADQLNPQN